MNHYIQNSPMKIRYLICVPIIYITTHVLFKNFYVGGRGLLLWPSVRHLDVSTAFYLLKVVTFVRVGSVCPCGLGMIHNIPVKNKNIMSKPFIVN